MLVIVQLGSDADAATLAEVRSAAASLHAPVTTLTDRADPDRARSYAVDAPDAAAAKHTTRSFRRTRGCVGVPGDPAALKAA